MTLERGRMIGWIIEVYQSSGFRLQQLCWAAHGSLPAHAHPSISAKPLLVATRRIRPCLATLEGSTSCCHLFMATAVPAFWQYHKKITQLCRNCEGMQCSMPGSERKGLRHPSASEDVEACTSRRLICSPARVYVCVDVCMKDERISWNVCPHVLLYP